MQAYQDHFLPIESDPQIFTGLAHDLGVHTSVAFEEILTLDSPPVLIRPALALILVFPTFEDYDDQVRWRSSQTVNEDAEGLASNRLRHLPQTINNACGLYAILHAILNSGLQSLIEPGSILAHINDRGIDSDILERLRESYTPYAMKGQSAVPATAEAEVDFHFVCFVRESIGGMLYEMDGDQVAPICSNVELDGPDILASRPAIEYIKRYCEVKAKGSYGFSLMALTASKIAA